MYLEAPESDTADRTEVPAGTRVVIGVACAGVLLIGLVPGLLLDIASDAVPVLVGG
jgi:NADH:ubiquinone oxidoreductase subunit 2 (subunit N)